MKLDYINTDNNISKAVCAAPAQRPRPRQVDHWDEEVFQVPGGGDHQDYHGGVKNK